MAEQHSSEKSVFLAALDTGSAHERAAFLDRACAGNQPLQAAVEALLAAHEKPQRLLDAPAAYLGLAGSPALAEAPAEGPGSVIGPYKLLEQIGEGGFGVVFMAEQTGPMRRKVALKVLKAGMDTRQVVARFEAERQALAIMDHANIAKVHDGGVTPAGRPYFVMELVKGSPITDFCDQHQLTPRQRLELFVPVCQAVQHAHQKGIIHRDLKPSNILVVMDDTTPVPKVIDFGIAKALGQDLTDKTLFTGLTQMIGTPLYMSPEQAGQSGLDVDTRSDIYSLGVLLYELLTATTPFDKQRFQQAAYDEICRIIREEEPSRPSTRFRTLGQAASTVSTNRMSDPTRLSQLIRGELDWIVMKALEKDRNRRYETAAALAADVQRYLHDEPVHACPPSAGYRLRKFARRNRGPVLAASLVLLALTGGIIGTTIGLVDAEQARQAEAKRADGERLAKEMAEKRLAQLEKGIDLLGSIFEGLDSQAEEKEGRPLREILGDRLDRAAAELAGDAVGDPLVVARLQDRLGRTYLSLGRVAEAEALFTKALATRNARLGAGHADTLAITHKQALAFQVAGYLPQAIERFEQVHDAQVKNLGADHLDTLNTLHDLGAAYRLNKRWAEAVPLLEQVRDARVKQLGADHPDTLNTRNSLARAYRAVGRLPEAIALFEQVHHARARILGPEDRETLITLHQLGWALPEGGRFADAIALFEQLRDAQVRKFGPDDPRTLTTLYYLALTYRGAERIPEAIAVLERARDLRLKKFEADNPDAIDTLRALAETYELAGNLDQALRLYQQAARAIERRKFVSRVSRQTIHRLSGLHEQLKQYAEAEVWRRKWLPVVQEKAGAESVTYAEDLLALGSNLLKQGKHAEAEPLLLRVCEGFKKREGKAPTPASAVLAEAGAMLVQLYEAWNKPEEAAKWRRELQH